MNYLKIFGIVLVTFTLFSSNTCKKSNPSSDRVSDIQSSRTHQAPVYKSFPNDPYADLWKQVQQYFDEGKYKSAYDIADQIDKRASQDKNEPEVVRSLLAKLNLAASFMEEADFFRIREIEGRILSSDGAQLALLHMIAGRMYWSYYQRNSYKINSRTTTQDFKNDDFRTWDASIFLEVSQGHYLKTLTHLESMKNYPIDAFKPILKDSEESNRIVNTLYDLLNIEILRFFRMTSSLSPVVEDNSGLSKLFTPYEVFMDDALEGIDNKSHIVILKRYQELLRNYHKNRDWDRVVFWDLERLDYLKTVASNEEQHEQYLLALYRIISQNLKTDEVAMAHAKLAHEVLNITEMPDFLGEKIRKPYAKEICTLAISKFRSECLGVQKCREIIANIENKFLSFQLERVNLANREAPLKVNYRNVDEVHFRLYRMIIDPLKNEENPKEINDYIDEIPVMSWSIQLRDFRDYEEHSLTTVLPKLPLGRYVLVASNTKIMHQESVMFYQDFFVSDMAFSSVDDKGAIRMMVHHAGTGMPLADVNLRIYSLFYNFNTRRYQYRFKKSLYTDKNGEQQYGTSEYSTSAILLVNGSDSLLVNNQYLSTYKESKPKVQEHLKIFTDRAIYRPGQQVFFKGILYSGASNEFKVVPKKKGKIILRDVNNQKVAEFKYVTNEFGSFSGSFTLPFGGLTGQFSIHDEEISSFHSILVEEYKRPKFEVKVLPMEGEYKFNEKITVKGEAKAYSGQAIDGAKVSYRIEESYQFPKWGWYWRGNLPSIPKKQVDYGETTTNDKGKFEIEFIAKPNRKYGKTPYFIQNYRVIIDVVDITGETQSTSQHVAVGNHAMHLTLNFPDVLDIKEFSKIAVSATNLNGQPVNAQGSIEIFALEEPKQIRRDAGVFKADYYADDSALWTQRFPHLDFFDLNNPYNFKERGVVAKLNFDTGKSTDVPLNFDSPLKPGRYKIKARSRDKFGEEIVIEKIITLHDARSKTAPTQEVLRTTLLSSIYEPGSSIEILISSAVEHLPVLLEVIDATGVVHTERLSMSKNQQIFRYKIQDKQRGGVFIRMCAQYQGELFKASHFVAVPFSNKELTLKFETFRDKLQPGQQEQWKMTIRGKKADKVAAELLAAMYDASLDQFAANAFNLSLYHVYLNQQNWFNRTHQVVSSRAHRTFQVHPLPALGRSLMHLNYGYYSSYNWGYLNDEGLTDVWNLDASGNPSLRVALAYVEGVRMPASRASEDDFQSFNENSLSSKAPDPAESVEVINYTTPLIDPNVQRQSEELLNSNPASQGQIRSNLNETAFFLPHVQTNAHGDVVLNFTMPEALTRWKFISLAHTKDMRVGTLSEFTMTQKELMIQPNPPRFLRHGDTLDFTAKISNLSAQALHGVARLELYDAQSMQPVNDKFRLPKVNPVFTLEKGENQSISWKIIVPDDVEALVYRVSADAGNFVDGEENMLPILTNRMLVIESLPLPSKGVGTKEFRFEKLKNSGGSKSIKHHSLTLEYTSNPAWYAVQAIPYLMEYPHECAEQLFARYYANALARHIVQSNPKIKEIFRRWEQESPESLISNLEKNQELKYLLLSETPWVMQAKDETERKKRLGMLFNLAKMERELESTMRKLQQMQSSNGGFPWFKGMPDNPYITKHIVMGAGHLDRLGIKQIKGDESFYEMLKKAVKYMDDRFYEQYLDNKKRNPDFGKECIIQFGDVQYLYARSYFNEIPMRAELLPVRDLYLSQMVAYKNEFSLQGRSMIALCLSRYNRKKEAQQIISALKDIALISDEMGMYWKDNVAGYFWHQAPIETQAILIEAFDEVTQDLTAVEEMKIWLLKNKQTNDWKTTKATTMAVYALLMRGIDLLAEDDIVDIFVGQRPMKSFIGNMKTEAGTGYFKHTWSAEEIQPIYGDVKVVRNRTGVSWGAMYWQYFDDLDKIAPHETPLKLKKQLFVVRNSPAGETMLPITANTKLKTGDKIRVRIELRTDRDMEFVHLKDMRAAGFEPINVLSSYKYQGGIGYYESTKDASTNFFIDFLRKGIYVFEYDLRANLMGQFSNGVATIQCMYAPEFTSHSEGVRVMVE
jgi:hypothetical protein